MKSGARLSPPLKVGQLVAAACTYSRVCVGVGAKAEKKASSSSISTLVIYGRSTTVDTTDGKCAAYRMLYSWSTW